MRLDKKIPVETLRTNFLARVVCANPKTAFETMMSCWIRHPRFESPTRQTIRIREKKDGFIWLTIAEVHALEAYVGCEMM